MLSPPKIITRARQSTLGIREKVPMSEIPALADRNFPVLFGWFADRGLTPVGPPFFRYHLVDMAGLLDLEIGLPVAVPVEGAGPIVADALPAGRYATLTHWGPYDRLIDANAALIGWARDQGFQWDAVAAADGDRFACRLEIYGTDPADEPDPSKWQTEVTIKLRD